jgi:hypothetical protein
MDGNQHSLSVVYIRSEQFVFTCCRRVALASTCLGRQNGQRTSAVSGRSKPPGTTSRTACQQVAAPRGLFGGRAPRWVLWVLMLHPRNLPANAAAMSDAVTQSIAMAPRGTSASAPASMTPCRPSLLAGQTSATLPDRVVLMKQDSARVAHVDVRVALSKSLPQSSDAGRYNFVGTACQC